jgi:hypothetical protein
VHQLRVYLDINTTTSREAGSFFGQLWSFDSARSSVREGSNWVLKGRCGGWLVGGKMRPSDTDILPLRIKLSARNLFIWLVHLRGVAGACNHRQLTPLMVAC